MIITSLRQTRARNTPAVHLSAEALRQAMRTGPFLHHPADIAVLNFATGGVPRSFSVILAAAEVTRSKDIDASKNGFVILDNDTGLCLASGIGRRDAEVAPAHRARDLAWLDRVAQSGWSGFQRLVRQVARPELHIARLADFGLPLGRPVTEGNAMRQARLGHDRFDPTDLRSADMIALDRDPAAEIHLPQRNRQGMVTDILRQDFCWHPANRTFHLAWDLSPALEMQTAPARAAAFERFIAPWCDPTTPPRILFDEDPRMEARFARGGEAGDILYLKSLGGLELGSAAPAKLREALLDLPGDALSGLWAATRAICEDLSPARLREACQPERVSEPAPEFSP